MRGLAIGIVLATAAASGAGAIDARGAAETHVERAQNGLNGCLEKSPDQLTVSKCYNRVAQEYAVKLKRAIEDYGDAAGAKTATGVWARLMAVECDQNTKKQFAGGSGQGTAQQVCEIYLLAARLDVMRVPTNKY